VANDFHSTGV